MNSDVWAFVILLIFVRRFCHQFKNQWLPYRQTTYLTRWCCANTKQQYSNRNLVNWKSTRCNWKSVLNLTMPIWKVLDSTSYDIDDSQVSNRSLSRNHQVCVCVCFYLSVSFTCAKQLSIEKEKHKVVSQYKAFKRLNHWLFAAIASMADAFTSYKRSLNCNLHSIKC